MVQRCHNRASVSAFERAITLVPNPLPRSLAHSPPLSSLSLLSPLCTASLKTWGIVLYEMIVSPHFSPRGSNMSSAFLQVEIRRLEFRRELEPGAPEE